MATGVESIPFATLVARRFRARLAIAKEADYASGCARRNIYYTQTIEYDTRRRSEGLSVPRQSLGANDNVLIASLVLTDGLDESYMAKIAGKMAKSNVAGVIGIFGIGDDYKKTLSHVTTRKFSGVRVEALYQTNPR